MPKNIRVLYLLMNGVLIGTLEKNLRGDLTLSYDDNWLHDAALRPLSLSLPLIEKKITGDTVFNFFQNLLPDSQKVIERIQTHFHLSTSHPFDLLAVIGKECVGAIQLLEDEQMVSACINQKNTVASLPLSENEIANILKNYQSCPLGMTDKHDSFRISIAGAQEKTAFLFYKNQWSLPLGATPTTHIFKRPIGFIAHQQLDLTDSIENEYLCLKIAKAFGLPIPNNEIKYFQNEKVLIVERFDREFLPDDAAIIRMPQEDLCQSFGLPSSLKYEADGGPGIKAIMQLLLTGEYPQKDREIFFRAQVLYWLLAAIDGHAKNFSIFIKPQGKFFLTPLYDILSAHPMLAKRQLQKQKIKMAMALLGENKHYHWQHASTRHFLMTAKLSQFSETEALQIIEEILDNVERVVDMVSMQLPRDFPAEMSDAIFNGMRNTKNRLLIS